MSKIRADIIFFDIDSTITDEIDKSVPFREKIFSFLSLKISERLEISLLKARYLLEDFTGATLIWWDYPDIIYAFGLSHVEVWRGLRELHKKHLKVYDDAVQIIKFLRGDSNGDNARTRDKVAEKRNHSYRHLYIISNNPLTGCLLKLERAGLGDLYGTKYFDRIFGTNIVRGCKSQLPMWERVLYSLDVHDKNIITIGDNAKEDYEIPSDAGVGHSFIIDRNISEPIISKKNHSIINNLILIKELIE